MQDRDIDTSAPRAGNIRSALGAAMMIAMVPAMTFPIDRARDWADQLISTGTVGNSGDHPLAMRDAILAYAVMADGAQLTDYFSYTTARFSLGLGECISKEEALKHERWPARGASDNAACLSKLTGVAEADIQALYTPWTPPTFDNNPS